MVSHQVTNHINCNKETTIIGIDVDNSGELISKTCTQLYAIQYSGGIL